MLVFTVLGACKKHARRASRGSQHHFAEPFFLLNLPFSACVCVPEQAHFSSQFYWKPSSLRMKQMCKGNLGQRLSQKELDGPASETAKIQTHVL